MTVDPAVDAEAVPLQQHREVGRFLQLDHEQVAVDAVRRRRRHDHAVAGVDGERHEQVEHRVGGLGLDQLGPLRPAHRTAWRRRTPCRPGRRVEHDPRLGLAERTVEVAACERAVRVDVHGQAFAGVEQLDEQRR